MKCSQNRDSINQTAHRTFSTNAWCQMKECLQNLRKNWRSESEGIFYRMLSNKMLYSKNTAGIYGFITNVAR